MLRKLFISLFLIFLARRSLNVGVEVSAAGLIGSSGGRGEEVGEYIPVSIRG